MEHAPIKPRKRKPVNLSLDTGIVAAARDLGINLSRVTEDALRQATREAEARQWIEQNRRALEDYNRWYREQGDPLSHLRAL
jgi:antitoxin CcdA